MALRRPHKRMKTVGRRAVRPKLVTSPSATAPLHTPWIPAPNRWGQVGPQRYNPSPHARMGGRIDEGMPRMANERLPERSIPDRSPGHAFIAIAHAGWCRHTKV